MTIYTGTAGNNIFALDELINSEVHGYSGNDVLRDTVNASVSLLSIVDSLVRGGHGNDAIIAFSALRSTIYGNTGNDAFTLAKVTESIIDGGSGYSQFQLRQ
jgi:Ca2+-binding RTX toxin-like protein